MVDTASTMTPLGTPAPDFSLPDTEGNIVSRDDFDDAPALLVMFLSNHCPYVKHVRSRLAELTREYMAKGVAVVGINSNDVDAYPRRLSRAHGRGEAAGGLPVSVPVRREPAGSHATEALHHRYRRGDAIPAVPQS